MQMQWLCIKNHRCSREIDFFNLSNNDKLKSRYQSGYVKGRYIGNNTRLILDIFEYCKIINTKGILLLADSKKSFRFS